MHDERRVMERYPPLLISEEGHYGFLHEVGVCALTGQETALEIEHMREIAYPLNKGVTGMAKKPHYAWTIPLAAELHQERHQMGASAFWRSRGWPVEDHLSGPLPACLVLFAMSCLQDAEGARRWILHGATERLLRRKGL